MVMMKPDSLEISNNRVWDSSFKFFSFYEKKKCINARLSLKSFWVEKNEESNYAEKKMCQA